jgi:hypothetical protein
MYNIDLTRTLFIQPTWSPNPTRLQDDPPFTFAGATDDTDEHSIEIEELVAQAELKQARRYDYYRDIVHISFVTPNPGAQRSSATHLIMAPTAAKTCPDKFEFRSGTLRRDANPITYVQYFEDETELLKVFWANMQPPNGAQWVAGWNIIHGVWPQLVGKALQYRIQVPAQFLADPLRRFQDPNVLAVDTIYTQGVYFKARPLPQLADLIEWWALPTDDNLPPLSNKQITELTVHQWNNYGCRTVEKYLHSMIDLVEYYYGDGLWTTSAKSAVDPYVRGPRPTH